MQWYFLFWALTVSDLCVAGLSGRQSGKYIRPFPLFPSCQGGEGEQELREGDRTTQAGG